MRIYANLPEKIRKEDVIVVIDDEPYAWNAAMIEVKNNSELGEKIIKMLENGDNMTNDKKLDEEIKKIVLWRLETSVPEYFKLSADEGTSSKEELRKHVEAEDKTEMDFVNMELNFIKAVASGKFSEALVAERYLKNHR